MIRPLFRLSSAIVATVTAMAFIPQGNTASADETPTLNGISAGEIDFASAEQKLFAELRDLPPADATSKLLEGAISAKSPADAMFLIGFSPWLRDELSIIAQESGSDPPRFGIDLDKSRELWLKALGDGRSDGFTFAGRNYTVGDLAAEILESFMVEDSDDQEALWTMWPSLGGHAIPWMRKRAEARLAGTDLPPFPGALPPDPKFVNTLKEEFLKSGRDERSTWLNSRSAGEIIALKRAAVDDPAFGRALLETANRIVSVVKTGRGIASPSDWKPKSTSLNRALINETVGFATALTTSGKRCFVEILREGGFGGIQITITPVSADSDALRHEAEDGTAVGGAADSLPFVKPFCSGAVVGRAFGNSAVWWVGTKPDHPDPATWTETLNEAALNQNELTEEILEVINDPVFPGDEAVLEFWCLPIDAGD